MPESRSATDDNVQREVAELRRRCRDLEQALAEARRVEKTPSENERFLADVFNCILDGISILAPDLRIVRVNRAMETWYGHAMPLVGKLCYEAYHGRSEPCPVCPTRMALSTGEAARERVLRRGAGGAVTGWLDLFSFPIRDEAGRVSGVIEYVRDITEQCKAEQALMASEKKYRQIVELSEEGIMVTDADFRIVFTNDKLNRMLGYEPGELIGVPVMNLMPAEEHADQILKLEGRRKGTKERYERRYRRKDGSDLIAIVSASPLMEEGRFLGSFALLSDITHIKQSEAALRSSEMRYRLLFSEMAEAFALHEMIWDAAGHPADYRFLAVNPAFERYTGLKADAVVGRTVREVLPDIEPWWIETYGRVVRTGEAATFEHYVAALKRHYRVHAYRTSENQFACLFFDITDQVRMEEERQRIEAKLQYAQKLESLGLLAGGIAHDFNNILMAILGNAELAREEMSPDSRAAAYLAEVEKACRRAADLCRQMLAYSGKTSLSMTLLRLNEVINDMASMLELSVSKKVVLRYNLAAQLPPILGDAAQIRQVVMNLVINGSEAIGERSGVVMISTGVMDCDEQYLAGTQVKDPLPAGRYVYLEVSDTGCGIQPEVLPRIFDPFFSTKFTGRGLGLAAVLGIVRGHKGAIKVYTEPGRGTTFKVLLPAMETAREDGSPTEEPARHAVSSPSLVMLVDDEESVLTAARGMLERLGYQVVTARHGREAINIFRARAQEIDCVLLDMTMPHCDGVETYGELRRIRSDIPVILCSGYTEDDATQRFVGRGLAGFLQKPYTLKALGAKLASVLEKIPPRGSTERDGGSPSSAESPPPDCP